MHRECGKVIEVRGDKILVESAPETGCSSCASRDSCVTGSTARKKRLWMANTLGARSGDMVAFTVRERGVVLASVLLYLLPVVFLTGGAVAGAMWGPGLGIEREAASALAGFAGIGVSFVLLYFITRMKSVKAALHPELREILASSGRDF